MMGKRPWQVGVNDRGLGRRDYIVFDADGKPLELTIENAFLIMIAPDLLEAIKELPLDAFDKDPADIDAAEFVDASAEFGKAMDLARAALVRIAELSL